MLDLLIKVFTTSSGESASGTLHSDCAYSLWDGWECQGRITTTISRGRVLVQDGAWIGPGGGGRFVPSGSPGQP